MVNLGSKKIRRGFEQMLYRYVNIIGVKVAVILLALPLTAHSLLGAARTGGISEVYIADTRIKVDGGFVEWFEGKDLSVRAKGLEISLNIDNSASKEDVNLNFVVSNVNPDITRIIGWTGGEIRKGANNLTFTVKVKAKKVAVYKLAPEIPEEGFKFMVFGESRGGEHVFRRIISDINYRKPLFAIGCGDMVDRATKGGFKGFMREIAGVKVPFLTAAGSSELDEGSRRLYEDYLGASYYSFSFKNNHFVVLDNGEGRMSEGQFLWLENDLMQSKAVNTFVFMHMPPFDPRPGRKQPMNLGGQHRRLSAILEKYKVKAVFTSGIHGYFRVEEGGIPYIITGGGGSELASADSFYNYIIVEVKGDKVKDKLIKLAMPPLGWYDSAKLKAKLYVKNSFETHPVRSSIISIIVLFFLLLMVRALLLRPSKRGKPKISI